MVMTLPPPPPNDSNLIDLRRDAPPPPMASSGGELWIRIDADAPELAAFAGMTSTASAPGDSFALEIGPDEPLAMALQRISLAQFDIALEGLRNRDNPDKGVHEARKAMKRIRAVLRLVRDVIGPTAYRAENTVLRDAARVVSPVRSSAVLVKTAAYLTRKDGNLGEELVAALEDEHQRILDRVIRRPQNAFDLITTVSSARSRFVGWPVHPGLELPREGTSPIPDEFSSIRRGLLRVYRRGHRAYMRALDHPDPPTLHELRKRVKYLRYQMEVLHRSWPEIVGGTARSLARLSDTLGDERDYAALAGELSNKPWLLPDDLARHNLILDIERRRFRLRRRSFERARLIYMEEPDAFVDRMLWYWDGWRKPRN